MENRKFDYFLICGYTMGILVFLFEGLKNGYKNIRIYQILMIVFWSICLFYKIKEVIKRNSDNGID